MEVWMETQRGKWAEMKVNKVEIWILKVYDRECSIYSYKNLT